MKLVDRLNSLFEENRGTDYGSKLSDILNSLYTNAGTKWIENDDSPANHQELIDDASLLFDDSPENQEFLDWLHENLTSELDVLMENYPTDDEGFPLFPPDYEETDQDDAEADLYFEALTTITEIPEFEEQEEEVDGILSKVLENPSLYSKLVSEDEVLDDLISILKVYQQKYGSLPDSDQKQQEISQILEMIAEDYYENKGEILEKYRRGMGPEQIKNLIDKKKSEQQDLNVLPFKLRAMLAKELIKLADILDRKDLEKEADYVDQLIKKYIGK